MRKALLALVVVAGLAVYAMRRQRPANGAGALGPVETNAQAGRRIWRDNHQHEDQARETLARQAFARAGWRCDRIERQLMADPGVWTFDCAPGYRYRLVFDADGVLADAKRLAP